MTSVCDKQFRGVERSVEAGGNSFWDNVRLVKKLIRCEIEPWQGLAFKVYRLQFG